MQTTPLPPRIARAMPFARTEVDAGGVALSVADDGPRDARETLLFVHGNPAWSFLWRRLMAPLQAAGHRVVAPDHAGFGASEKPREPGYYSLERHVDNLVAVVRALDLRDVTLVLHDWGGPIGMGLAVAEPQRVKRILACNTVAFAPREKRPFTAWHRTFASPLGYRLGVALNLVEASAMRYGVRKPLPRDVREAYGWPMRDKGARIAAGRFVQMVPDGPDHPEAATFRAIEERFPKLAHAPVHVLWADRDPVMRPRLAKRWKETPLDVRTVEHVAPDAGHFWQEDDPGPFTRRILSLVEG